MNTSTYLSKQSSFVKNYLQSRKRSQILFYLVIGLELVINLIIAIAPPTFFHPDEVYQSLEIAHKFVYGYGIVSWEWQVGSWPTPSNPAGYGPIRSLFTPLIFGLFFIIGEGLKLNYWNAILPLIRIVLFLNFFLGLFFASKVIKELDPNKNSHSNQFFLVLSLIYFEFLLYGSKTITNTLVLPMMFFPLYIWIKKDIDKRKDNWALEGISGFLVGLSIWLRPDSGIIMAFFVLLYMEKLKVRKFFTFGIGFILSAISNGLLDLLYYGNFFVSFPNFLKFNSENQSVFGTEPFGWYFNDYIILRGTLFYLFILISICFLSFFCFYIYITYFKGKNNQINKHFQDEFIFLIKLLFWSFIILLWWESQPHKEERFMIAWQVTYLILASYVITILAKYTKKLLEKYSQDPYDYSLIKKITNSKKYKHFSLYFVIIIVICTPFMIFNTGEAVDSNWNNFNDILEAFVWIGQQKNVTGVAIVMPLWYSGGYSYLHRNVPLYHLDKPINEDQFLPKELANQHLINYLVIPKYRYYEIPGLYNSTVTNGFKLVHVVFGSTDIWYI